MSLPVDWTHKLSNRFNQLPLVLVGPMLRRVKNNSVSVFLALKESRTVTLKVFNESGTVMLSGTKSTISLGNNIHVVVVTASEGTTLQPNVTYTYDIEFGNPSTTLGTPGVLKYGSSGLYKITYIGQALPSFALPPSDVENLRILHASCRKPHGESADALSGISDILEDAIGFTSYQTAIDRPHQLYLTGDQIYADDVSDRLLFMIRDAASVLFQWNETLPGVSSSNVNLRVGRRKSLIKDTAKFSKLDGDQPSHSHLIYLTEFFTMYLFVWSPELWPASTSDFPIENNIYHDFENVDLMGASQDSKKLDYFFNDLPKVRKLLANIPTYMIFDDHEITDDWFMNLRWSNEALSSSLGKRIMQNGLTAYAVFQGWGNTSWRFDDTNEAGWKLLYNLNQNATSNNFDGNVPDLAISYWQRFGQLVGMPTIESDDYHKRLVPNSQGIRWDYTLEFPYFQVLVLNIRTMREFTNKTYDWYPNLLSRHEGAAQLNSIVNGSNFKFHVIVSPGPFIGVPRVEWWKRDFIGSASGRFQTRDAEDWGLNDIGFERFLGKLSDVLPNGRIVLLSGDVHYSSSSRMEYWATNAYGSSLSNNAHMVIAQLTASSLRNETYGLLGTLGLHTKGWRVGDGTLEKPSLAMGFQNPDWDRITIGTGKYETEPNSFYTGSWKVSGNPAMTNVSLESETRKFAPDKNLNLTKTPDWQYRIDYKYDSSVEIDPTYAGNFSTQNVMPPPHDDRMAALQQYLGAAKNSAEYNKIWGDGKEIVGKNNFGEVRFLWGDGEYNKRVKHAIWWRLQSNLTSQSVLPTFPLTNVEFSLGKGLTAYPKPEDDLN